MLSRLSHTFVTGWRIAVGFLATVFLLLNHLLVQGVVTATSDADGYFYPYYVLVADFARAGRLLLWDPWSSGGLPILGDPQVGALSPLVLASGLLTGGSSRGFIFYWLAIWLLGGLGMLLLARHFRVPAWGGGGVALGFLFCGLYTGDAQFVSWVAAFSFLPFIVWRLDVALESSRLLPAVQAGALWGLAALGSYPGFTIMTGIFCALWALGRYVTRDSAASAPNEVTGESTSSRPRVSARVAVLAVALIAVVGVLILAPTYVAFFVEGAGYHRRVDILDRNLAISGNRLAPGALSTFASPYIALIKYYNPFNVFLRNAVPSCSVYAGVVISAFGLYALLRRPKSAWQWWLVAIGLFFLAAALGDDLPVRGLLYDYFPPARYFRHSALMRSYAIFVVAVLALLGCREFAESGPEDRRREGTRLLVAAGVLAALGVAVLAGFALGASNLTMPYAAWGWIHLAVVWSGLIGTAALFRYGPEWAPRIGVPILILVVGVADAYLTGIIMSPITVDADERVVKRWEELDRAHVSEIGLRRNGMRRTETPCGTNPECKTNRHLITKVPALSGFSTEKNAAHAAMVDTPALRAVATGDSRVWFAREAVMAAPESDAIAALAGRATKLGVPPLVVTPRDVMTGDAGSNEPSGAEQIANAASMERVPATVQNYTSDRLDLRVTVPADGWLLVTDRWAQGWTALVNGQPATIEGGNFLFRAVRVQTGENVVEFAYHPFGMPWLLILSWTTLAAVIAWTMAVAIRARRAQGEPDAEAVPPTPGAQAEPEPLAAGEPRPRQKRPAKRKRR